MSFVNWHEVLTYQNTAIHQHSEERISQTEAPFQYERRTTTTTTTLLEHFEVEH